MSGLLAIAVVGVIIWWLARDATEGGGGTTVNRPKMPEPPKPPKGAKPGAAPGIWSIEVDTARAEGWGRQFGLIWRFPDATWLIDLRDRDAADIGNNSLAEELDADMETAGHPGKLRIWVVTGEQARAWNADTDTLMAVLDKLVGLSTQALGPVQPGEALVIVGEPEPDRALVHLMKSGGFSVWHLDAGKPVPALIVGTGGQLVSGMHGDSL